MTEKLVRARSDVSLGIDEEALFSHPDDSRLVDAMENPLREISTQLHAMGPVIKGLGVGTPLGSAIKFGDVVLPNIFIAARLCERDVYAVTNFEAARKLYLNPKIFSSSAFQETIALWGPTLTAMDPPEHLKYRSVVQSAFSAAALGKHEAELIRPTMARRFSELKPKGRADLVRDLTPYNAYDITGGIIGFDPEDIAYVATCLTDAHAANVDPKRARAGIDAQRAYAKELIDARRAAPRDDLLSSMIKSEVDGNPITDEYLIGLVNMLLGGGIETIYKQSGNIVALLIDHPDQFDLLRANRELIPRFVDESLRYEGVASMFARQATEESTLLGTVIPKDAIVFGLNGVVNRDPSRWNDPHRLDVLREVKPHMQFSSGAHSCLGALVARRALSVLVEHLIDDLPSLRWDPSKPRPRITGWHFRSPLSLPVLWGPASPL